MRSPEPGSIVAQSVDDLLGRHMLRLVQQDVSDFKSLWRSLPVDGFQGRARHSRREGLRFVSAMFAPLLRDLRVANRRRVSEGTQS